MNSIILAFILTVNVALLAMVLYCILKVSHVFRQVSAFITPEGEGKPSQLAQVTQVAADMLGRGVSASIKATFMGKQKQSNAMEARVDGDIAGDMLSMANPLVGQVLQSFPALKKTLTRNPALLDYALSKLVSGQAPAAPVASGNGEVKFNL